MKQNKGYKTFSFAVRGLTQQNVSIDARTPNQALKLARSLYGAQVSPVKESDR